MEYIRAHEDDSVYTEFYRKLGTGPLDEATIDGLFREEGERCQKPCCVGIICDLSSYSRNTVTNARVRVLYRPEDTSLSDTEAMHEPLNKLYWSDEIKEVRVATILQRCRVVRLGSEEERRQAEMEWADRPGVFFLDSERMCTQDGAAFLPLPSTSPELPPVTTLEPLDNRMSKSERLRCMELFSGCGGLSAGLHESGVAEALWAVELEEGASESFRRNNPGSEVFQDDCNTLLAEVIAGKRENSLGQRYPQKGDVELVVGGPPCQGYSGLNRFSQGDYSKFRNSLVVSFLSFVDHYRPKYVVFENVQRFATFKKGAVLQLVVSSFLALGYQCTVGVLQAGAYGVPQTRRRTVILAAAPGFVLPRQPAPLNAFYKSLSQLRAPGTTHSLLRGSRAVHALRAAPYRGITVYDAVADLPPIAQACGDEDDECEGAHAAAALYPGAPLTTFQRTLRAAGALRVTAHQTRSVRPLVLKRIELVPRRPYADWRDLPNVAATLCDGTHVDPLAYHYDDVRAGRAKNNALRGVCPCAEGRPCDPAAVIPNTIIPWCLPHTCLHTVSHTHNIAGFILTLCFVLPHSQMDSGETSSLEGIVWTTGHEQPLQHDGDVPRADGEAGARAAPEPGPHHQHPRVRALPGLPGHVPLCGDAAAPVQADRQRRAPAARTRHRARDLCGTAGDARPHRRTGARAVRQGHHLALLRGDPPVPPRDQRTLAPAAGARSACPCPEGLGFVLQRRLRTRCGFFPSFFFSPFACIKKPVASCE